MEDRLIAVPPSPIRAVLSYGAGTYIKTAFQRLRNIYKANNLIVSYRGPSIAEQWQELYRLCGEFAKYTS